MAELEIAAKWDDGTNIGVRCFEVVMRGGEQATFQYTAEVAKAGKTANQIKTALRDAIKTQRDARIASAPAHVDVDLGGTTLTVADP